MIQSRDLLPSLWLPVAVHRTPEVSVLVGSCLAACVLAFLCYAWLGEEVRNMRLALQTDIGVFRFLSSLIPKLKYYGYAKYALITLGTRKCLLRFR